VINGCWTSHSKCAWLVKPIVEWIYDGWNHSTLHERVWFDTFVTIHKRIGRTIVILRERIDPLPTFSINMSSGIWIMNTRIDLIDWIMILVTLITLLLRDVIVYLSIEAWERREGRSYLIIIDERHQKASKQSKDDDFKR
jgi:hypothetical protein